MIRPTGTGDGDELDRGYGHVRSDTYFVGDGRGHGYNVGTNDGGGVSYVGYWGDGYGDGVGDGIGDRHGPESLYVTSLIIDSDPLTTAYQSWCMQASGEDND